MGSCSDARQKRLPQRDLHQRTTSQMLMGRSGFPAKAARAGPNISRNEAAAHPLTPNPSPLSTGARGELGLQVRRYVEPLGLAAASRQRSRDQRELRKANVRTNRKSRRQVLDTGK